MKTVDLTNFDDPWELYIWMCHNWGPPGFNNDRWDLRDLTYLDLNNEMDLTFILLKFKQRNEK